MSGNADRPVSLDDLRDKATELITDEKAPVHVLIHSALYLIKDVLDQIEDIDRRLDRAGRNLLFEDD